MTIGQRLQMQTRSIPSAIASPSYHHRVAALASNPRARNQRCHTVASALDTIELSYPSQARKLPVNSTAG